jgi:DNA polymerase-3 subunit delta
MNYNEFMSCIKKDKILPVYFLSGNEEYLMKEAVEALKDKYIDKSFEALNYVIIDGKEKSFDDILNACETLPFMSEKKLVVIKDISEIMENNLNELDKTLSSYIENLDSYLCLIIMDRSNNFKKTTKLYKTINKLGGVVEFNSLKGRELNTWVENKFKKNNKKISASNISYFIGQSSYSDYNSIKTLYDLENELTKVVDYTSNNEVNKEDIDLVLTKTLDTNIFNLLGSINKRDSEESLKIFNEMYIAGEPVQKILSMIIRQLRLTLGYKLYKEKGYTDGEIGDKLGIKPFELKKIGKESNNFTEVQLNRALNYILELDIKQKTSSHDEKLALEMLIVNLSYGI